MTMEAASGVITAGNCASQALLCQLLNSTYYAKQTSYFYEILHFLGLQL